MSSALHKEQVHTSPKAHQIRQVVESDDNDLAIMISMVNSYQLSMKSSAHLNQSIFNVLSTINVRLNMKMFSLLSKWFVYNLVETRILLQIKW